VFPSSEQYPAEANPLLQDESLLLPRLEWLLGLSESKFRGFFRGSAVKRAKWRGLLRNACIAVGNSSLSPGTAVHTRICGALKRLAAQSDHLIAESAQWALSRIQ
jgi:epoxyqueuosine reductase